MHHINMKNSPTHVTYGTEFRSLETQLINQRLDLTLVKLDQIVYGERKNAHKK